MNTKNSYRKIPATPLRPVLGEKGLGDEGLEMVSQALGRSELEPNRFPSRLDYL